MNITIPIWVIPIVLSVVILAIMFRPYHKQGDYDFGDVARLLWLVPLCMVWIAWSVFLWLRGGS